MRVRYLFFCFLLILSSCGTFTGLPSHGGGKRFAIEQELISASVRAVAKDLQVWPLVGKKVALYVVVIGDEGGGNLVGGRFSLSTAFRENYINSPVTTTTSSFPTITGTTTNKDSGGSVTSTTETQNVVNSPSSSQSSTSGSGSEYSITASSPRTNFSNQQFYNPKDRKFLNAVLQEALFLKGVILVEEQHADISLFVTVDIFGTIRSKRNWIFVNQERLMAKTGLEIIAIDNNAVADKRILIKPKTSVFEAEYIEQYYLWNGPFTVRKEVRRSPELLVNFKNLKSSDNIQRNEKGLQSPILN